MTSPVISAADGKSLHNNNCIECHSRMTGGDGHVLYTRDDRIANTLGALHERVEYCSHGINSGWTESEINAVTQFLNEQYYHF